MDTIHYMLDNCRLSRQPYLSASLAGRAGRPETGDYHRRTVRRFDRTPQMAGNAGIGRRHATSYHSVYRAVWINDPAFFR